jgi:predicted nuclease of predicted toxin-antitoxin system
MKILLDQGLLRSSAAILRTSGVDAVHTGQCGLATASDRHILDFARTQGCIIVTLDADFHMLMALSNASQPSVIRIRIEGLGSKAIADILQVVVNQCAGDLQRGALVSVEKERVRLRQLPIETGT